MLEYIYKEWKERNISVTDNCVLLAINVLYIMLSVYRTYVAKFFIFLIGAPCFFLVNVLNSILDCIFPEGWDNEDPFSKY